MENGPTSTEELMRQLKEVQARLNAPAGPAPTMAPAPMMSLTTMQPNGQPVIAMAPPHSAMRQVGGVQIAGLLVAINVPTPEGDVTCHLQLGPEAAANPQQAILQLMQAGWPVRAFRGGNNRFGGGGFNRGGGGFGGGGFGGRGWSR